jgi:uncharacterized SAM-binding protein YcdF (DUF218 family)
VFLLNLLKSIGGPGSLGFLVVGVAAGVGLLFVGPRARRWARRWLILLAAAYFFLSLPVVATALAAYAPASWSALHAPRHGVDRLIVIDGDNRLGRAREAAAWYRASTPRPDVLVSGSAFMVQPLIDAGIPPGQFRLADRAQTTRAQVRWMRGLPRGPRTVVIASRLQVPRLAALMSRAGIGDLPIVAARVDREPRTRGPGRWLPSWAALMVSRDACYERLALLYYRWRGWI